jgi:hypothetical protein
VSFPYRAIAIFADHTPLQFRNSIVRPRDGSFCFAYLCLYEYRWGCFVGRGHGETGKHGTKSPQAGWEGGVEGPTCNMDNDRTPNGGNEGACVTFHAVLPSFTGRSPFT